MPVINTTNSKDLSLIEDVAIKAGEIAMKYFGKDPEVWYKGEARSPVSQADLEIDQFLKSALLEARPGYGWLSEETEDNSERLETETVFVVDPIDGTRAFIRGNNDWCVSIGIVKNGVPVHGVLVAPMSDQIFTASKNTGSFLNKAKLDTQPQALSEPPRVIIPQEVTKSVDKAYKRSVEDIKGASSLALRIAALAYEPVDGIYIRKNSHDWDLVAADLIIREVGYRLVDDNNNDVVYNKTQSQHGLLFASSPGYIMTMKEALINR